MDKAQAEGIDRLGYKLLGGFARIFGALSGKGEETYWYPIVSTDGEGFVDLAATIGDVAQASIGISAEADFVATRILAQSINPVSGVILANPSWAVQIVDGGSDRQFSSCPIHVDTLAGNSRDSVPFTKNRLFKRKADVTFEFTNLQAVATRVYMVMQGYKIFDEASLDLTRRR